MNTQQKQLLGVGAGAVGLLAIYSRVRKGGTHSTTRVPIAAGGQVNPYTPQSPVTLQPGESVYDPNSEGLLGTGFAPGTGSTVFDPGQTVYDPSAGGIQPPQSNTPGGPAYVVNVQYPQATPTPKPSAPKPKPKRPTYAPKKARHTGATPPGPGWRGIGGGWWAPPQKKGVKQGTKLKDRPDLKAKI